LFEQRLNLNEFEAKKDSQSEVLFLQCFLSYEYIG